MTGGFLFGICPFLGPAHRLAADVLVVEGWVHPYAIRAAVEEFKTGSYRYIVTTGGPVLGTGEYTNDFNTSASVGAERLVAAGMPAELVRMAPARNVDRDRTYSSALVLKTWLRTQPIPVTRINVLTEDVHARRTWLLFQKALGSEVAVGIVSIQNPDYDWKRWWRFSEGVREVLGETIAYAYVKLVFPFQN
ncbi:MAG: YdcF family protein [Opitutaceae bacterium]